MIVCQNFPFFIAVPGIHKKASARAPGEIDRSIRPHRVTQCGNKTLVFRGGARLASIAGMRFARHHNRQNISTATELLEIANGFIHPNVLSRAGRTDHHQAEGLLQRPAILRGQGGLVGQSRLFPEKRVNSIRNDLAPTIDLADEIRRDRKSL